MVMRRPAFWFLTILFLLFSHGRGGERKEYVVSPAGDDRNPGTVAQPFRTLERGRDAVRDMRKTSAMPDGGVTIYLRGGEHFRETPFVLTPEDAGEENSLITYAAYPGETPIVTGGKTISGWRKVTEPIKGLHPRFQGRIYAAPIRKGWKFHFLFLNGTPLRLSRLWNSDAWFTWPKVEQVGPVGPGGQTLTFPRGTLDDLEGLDGQIELNLLPVNFWNTISVLRGIDPRRATAVRHSKNPTTFWKESFQEGNFNLLNAVRFIDEPGEWAVDTAQGLVFLLPPNGTLRPDDELIAPVTYRLVHVRGDEVNNRLVQYLLFEGIEFRHTDRMPEDIWPEEWIKRQAELPDAMVYMEDVADLEIRRCVFLHSGSYGIDLERHAQRITIRGNEMGWMGCGGVLLQGYGPGTRDVNRHNVITGNNIHHTGAGGYLHSAAITLYQSGSNDISFNVIHHIPYVGVQICGTNWDAYGRESLSRNPDPDDPGGVDAYGKADAQFQTRWGDFPEGRDVRFSRESIKPYLHTTNNRVHHNIVMEYLQVLSDGAPLYAWSTGMGNLFYNNLMKRRAISVEGQKWIFALYMDDNVDGAVLTDNVVWAQVDPDPDRVFYNKGKNMWSGNTHRFPEKPDGYDALLRTILEEGKRRGGWPGDIPGEISSFFQPQEQR